MSKSNSSKRHIKEKEFNPAMRIRDFYSFSLQVLKEINYAREHPDEFLEKLNELKETIKDSKDNCLFIENVPFIYNNLPKSLDDAINFLENQKELPQLIYNKTITQACDYLLDELVSHDGLDDDNADNYSLENRLSKFGHPFGENYELIDYGMFDPEFIVINFILGDGDKNKFERNVIFNPKMKYIGIASGILSSEKICTIINFCEEFYDLNEKIPSNIERKYNKKVPSFNTKTINNYSGKTGNSTNVERYTSNTKKEGNTEEQFTEEINTKKGDSGNVFSVKKTEYIKRRESIKDIDDYRQKQKDKKDARLSLRKKKTKHEPKNMFEFFDDDDDDFDDDFFDKEFDINFDDDFKGQKKASKRTTTTKTTTDENGLKKTIVTTITEKIDEDGNKKQEYYEEEENNDDNYENNNNTKKIISRKNKVKEREKKEKENKRKKEIEQEQEQEKEQEEYEEEEREQKNDQEEEEYKNYRNNKIKDNKYSNKDYKIKNNKYNNHSEYIDNNNYKNNNINNNKYNNYTDYNDNNYNYKYNNINNDNNTYNAKYKPNNYNNENNSKDNSKYQKKIIEIPIKLKPKKEDYSTQNVDESDTSVKYGTYQTYDNRREHKRRNYNQEFEEEEIDNDYPTDYREKKPKKYKISEDLYEKEEDIDLPENATSMQVKQKTITDSKGELKLIIQKTITFEDGTVKTIIEKKPIKK
jgi:hypothetical protein